MQHDADEILKHLKQLYESQNACLRELLQLRDLTQSLLNTLTPPDDGA